MPLESCMLVLDNSEYMRNGDYVPTRFQAQSQAVSTIFSSKTDNNPESAVGLMTMAGKSPSLLVTPTNDIGKLLSALSKSHIGGLSDFQTSVQIAQLALKHRENKNQRQRIVVFVGSPLSDGIESLTKLGKKLRKNNVLIDVVCFGDEGLGEEEKLGALVEAAGGGESHLVSIPPGQHLLSDIIRTSPILSDGQAHAGGSGEPGMEDLDPNMDPELAMAIRMSLQEAQEAAARQNPPPPAASSSTAPAPTTSAALPESAGSATGLPSSLTAPLENANTREPVAPGDSGVIPPPQSHPTHGIITDDAMVSEEQEDDEDEDEDEEAMLARAMALSRGEGEEGDVAMAEEDDDDEEEEEDEEAAIARAIQMSLEESEKEGGDKS